MHFFKKNIINILLILSIIAFVTVSVIKITTVINYNNASNLEKAKILASALNEHNTHIEEDVIIEEIDLLFNKYSELGYNLENANFNIIANFILNIYENHDFCLKFEKYLTENQVDFINKTEFVNKIFTDKENTNIILQNNLYYSYLIDTSYNYFIENENFDAEKKEIEDYITNEISTEDEQLITAYKSHLYNNILEQKFFEKIQQY